MEIFHMLRSKIGVYVLWEIVGLDLKGKIDGQEEAVEMSVVEVRAYMGKGTAVTCSTKMETRGGHRQESFA